MPDYLTLVEVLFIHERQIRLFGGSGGVRDYGALESALYRAQTGYYDDLIEEAAALWESLSQNHPFIDGNKRTAFAAMYTFLRINGIHLKANPISSYKEIITLYELGDFEFKRLVAWLRSNLGEGS